MPSHFYSLADIGQIIVQVVGQLEASTGMGVEVCTLIQQPVQKYGLKFVTLVQRLCANRRDFERHEDFLRLLGTAILYPKHKVVKRGNSESQCWLNAQLIWPGELKQTP